MSEVDVQEQQREEQFKKWLQENTDGLPVTVSPIVWMKEPPSDDQLSVWREQYGQVMVFD